MSGEPSSEPREARPRVAGPARAGLVRQATSQTLGRQNLSSTLRELGHRRRLRRLRKVVTASADAARQAVAGGRGEGSALLVTLTYRPGVEWRGNHVSRFIDVWRQWMRRRKLPVRYQWVLELTQAGVPHYHALLWVPKGLTIPKPDKAGWWPHGFTRVERARRPVGYLVKYVSKGLDGEHKLPKGARTHGCGLASPAERLKQHRAGLPAWLNTDASEGTRVKRVPRAGWVEVDTGVVHQSRFRMRWVRDAESGVVSLIIEEMEHAYYDQVLGIADCQRDQ